MEFVSSDAGNVASVITSCHSDNMIRTQISVDEETYRRAQALAKEQGISLAELCRRGLEAMLARKSVSKPWMDFAGIVEGAADDSTSVDDIVYGRAEP